MIRVFVWLSSWYQSSFISLQLSQILSRSPFCTPVTNDGRFLLQAGRTHTTSTSILIHCPSNKMVSTRTAATTLTPYQPEVEPKNDKTSEINVKLTTLKEQSFGSVGTPRKGEFTIHPEWASEQLPRRSKSAPPPRSRNPITWQ